MRTAPIVELARAHGLHLLLRVFKAETQLFFSSVEDFENFQPSNIQKTTLSL